MIDSKIWLVLEEAFTPAQILEMRELLESATKFGGRDLDILPQTLFKDKYCAICATFYAREVAELWIGLSAKLGRGRPYDNPKRGYRACIDYYATELNPFWPGW